MGVPVKHPFLDRNFNYKPSSYGDIPIGNHNIMLMNHY